MIGGTVIETVVDGDKVWINCQEDQSSSTCGIYVELSDKARCVSEGDSVWWQGGFAMWTPAMNQKRTCNHAYHYSCHRVGVDYDIQLKRVGFSGVSRPTQEVTK